MADIVSFKIQVEGSGEIKTVSASAKELGEAFDAVRDKTKALKSEWINLASISQALSGISNALQQVEGLTRGLTSAYTAQVEAETLLATAMRNTMDASDEEIARIKQLTAEQQRLGVVGDEVQLAAAQELATYLTLSSSLETIIPTLNDMVAQQLRLGASAESATQIATMLGKVMNGQTKALSRYGYEFSEAQEYILKFGEESERAAVLVDVVGQSVGGANRNVRESVGAYQDMLNTLGDVQESIGRITYQFQPFVTALSQVGMATMGVMQLASALKAIIPVQSMATAGAKLYSAGLKMLGISAHSAAAGTTAARIAVAALYATLTMGVSIAVTALVSLLGRLGQKGKDAADGIDEAKDAQKAFTDASMSARLQLAEEIINLEALIKSKRDASKAVADLNSRYGAIFGSHKTAAEWYDTLTSKSAAYAKQLGYEAQAKVLASQKAAKELEKTDKENRMRQLADKAADPVNNYGTVKYKTNSVYRQDAAEYARLMEDTARLSGEISNLGGQFDTCTKKMAEAASEIGTVTTAAEESGKKTRTLAGDIAEYRQSVERAVQAGKSFGGYIKESDAEAAQMDMRLKAMQSGITSLIGKYGSESSAIQQLISEYRQLLEARKASVPDVARVAPRAEWDAFFDTSRNVFEGRAYVASDYKTVHGKKELKPYDLGPALPVTVPENDRAVQMYRNIKAQIPGADPATQKMLKEQLQTLAKLYDIPEAKNAALESSVDTFGALAGALQSLGGIMDDSAASWITWGANLMKAIGQALPQLAALFSAETAVAGAGAMSSVASIPIAGPVLAIAALGTIVAAAASLPKFAQGGLAYGTTLGVFGEYPGAAQNPEVVAPLDKLRQYMSHNDGGGKVEFIISGRNLKGILRRQNRLDSRNNG